jgi:Uma2 family endonuclease
MASAVLSDVHVDRTLADVLERLGGIPLNRIRTYPPMGTATERDVLKAEARTGRICELVDGILVEKTVGYYESALACALIYFLHDFLSTRRLGAVLGEAGALKILHDLVRIPDVSFIGWDRFPGGELPREPIPAVAPDLAVEVLSKGNTEAEMTRKLDEYFRAGVRLVWYIDPETRSARVYTAPDKCVAVDPSQSLDGSDVLPGFRLPLADLFAKAERHGRG